MQTLKRFDIDVLDPVEPAADAQPIFTPPVALADAFRPDVPSPARALQQRLLDEMKAEAMDDDGVRWAPRTTLLFCGGVSLALWGVIALGVAAFH